jgi:hypothetical protein
MTRDARTAGYRPNATPIAIDATTSTALICAIAGLIASADVADHRTSSIQVWSLPVMRFIAVVHGIITVSS